MAQNLLKPEKNLKTLEIERFFIYWDQKKSFSWQKARLHEYIYSTSMFSKLTESKANKEILRFLTWFVHLRV